MSKLARPAGVRVRVSSGRGYSFAVRTEATLHNPLYLPAVRVACTRADGGMRLAGAPALRSL